MICFCLAAHFCIAIVEGPASRFVAAIDNGYESKFGSVKMSVTIPTISVIVDIFWCLDPSESRNLFKITTVLISVICFRIATRIVSLAFATCFGIAKGSRHKL